MFLNSPLLEVLHVPVERLRLADDTDPDAAHVALAGDGAEVLVAANA